MLSRPGTTERSVEVHDAEVSSSDVRDKHLSSSPSEIFNDRSSGIQSAGSSSLSLPQLSGPAPGSVPIILFV